MSAMAFQITSLTTILFSPPIFNRPGTLRSIYYWLDDNNDYCMCVCFQQHVSKLSGVESTYGPTKSRNTHSLFCLCACCFEILPCISQIHFLCDKQKFPYILNRITYNLISIAIVDASVWSDIPWIIVYIYGWEGYLRVYSSSPIVI